MYHKFDVTINFILNSTFFLELNTAVVADWLPDDSAAEKAAWEQRGGREGVTGRQMRAPLPLTKKYYNSQTKKLN
jgi:hypothetical protein